MSFRKPLPSQEALRAHFDYDIRGFLIPKNVDARARRRKEVKHLFYRKIRFQNTRFYLHQLVWVWHYGDCPKYIDHINRNHLDNRIENLRAATQSLNLFNTKLFKNNTTGTRGLYLIRKGQACYWIASARINGKRIYICCSKDKEVVQQRIIEFQKLHHGEFYAELQ